MNRCLYVDSGSDQVGYYYSSGVVVSVLYVDGYLQLGDIGFHSGYWDGNKSFPYLDRGSNYYPHRFGDVGVVENVYGFRNVTVCGHLRATGVGYRPR